MSTFDAMMAIEDGELDYLGMVAAFQVLIDDGIVWKLQGSYGRTAARLIELGHCVRKGGK